MTRPAHVDESPQERRGKLEPGRGYPFAMGATDDPRSAYREDAAGNIDIVLEDSISLTDSWWGLHYGPQAGGKVIVGRSPAMIRVYDLLPKLAGCEHPVLIEGPSGTGKEIIANALGSTVDGPRVTAFCTALSEALIESELFGHCQGAFTTAVADRIGWVETAQGGTLFLDEICKVGPWLQAKLLRFVETKEFSRVGETRTREADSWLLFGTNRRLEEEVRAGRFLEDLYYRISALRVSLPPLNERGDDAILLATFFIRQKNKEGKRKVKVIDREAVAWIRSYPWPGNVRELQNAITRGFLLGSGEVLRLPELFDEHPLQLLLPKPVVGYANAGQLPKDARKSLSPDQEALLKCLRQIGRLVTSAEVAEALGKDIRKIQRDLKDLRNRGDVTQERAGKVPRYSTSGPPSPASDGAHQSPILPAGGPSQVPFGNPNPPRTTLGMYGTPNT